HENPSVGGRNRELVRLSDEALLSLVATSDEDALAELYDRFGGIAYGLALRILRDEALAQDAVQEAFVSVWRTADRFLAERARASTWILTLVHRRAVDLVRREDRRRGEPLEAAPEPTASETVEEEATLGFQRRVVQEALRRLPPEQREALELGYYGGLTQSQLGGHGLYLAASDLQLGRGETLRDTATVLSRYLDGLMIRTFAQDDVEELARHATIPVINGLTDSSHPCQALADVMTIRERLGRLEGVRVAYLGDGNNVCASLMVAAAKLGMEFVAATPEGYEPDPQAVELAREAGGNP